MALVAANRKVLLRQSFNPDDDSAADTAFSQPPVGFERIDVPAPFYAAYVRCP